MPFYEYQCQRCGHHLEAMQKLSDAPLKKCPECGKNALQRQMSAPVFRLKGGGWYETDFKSDGEGKRNLADRPEADAAKDDKKVPATADVGAKEGTAKETAPKEAAPKESAPAKDEKKPAAVPNAAKSASKSATRPVKRPGARAAAPRARRAVKKTSRRR
ncbi:MAG: FmdB family zinc ribbon protein [Steroidobacterales bacterium]